MKKSFSQIGVICEDTHSHITCIFFYISFFLQSQVIQSIHKTPQNDNAHTLNGSVQKRLHAFSSAYYHKFGSPAGNKEPMLQQDP